MIAGLALMMQCYLVTEEDNQRLNSDNEVFQWLVAVLDCAVCGKLDRGLEFAAIEVVEVIDVSSVFYNSRLFRSFQCLANHVVWYRFSSLSASWLIAHISPRIWPVSESILDTCPKHLSLLSLYDKI